ncbi:DUF4215 domain-containing protein [Archangium minus]|uniref:DUF4215 domain-containing protein n=1 Tax=Archangium minus TaxID=83450 RepID=A0ABY9X726_9BACT|nr:DUF4215 domain-containing protein [Archangium minus]
MRQELPLRVHPGSVIPLVLVLLLLPLQSCLEPLSVECGPDLVCPPGQRCAANQNVCISTDCGDGIRQEGEACDDGNSLDGDGCSSTCASTEVCGNGITDKAAGEVCDNGDNPQGECSSDCRSYATCGNGSIDNEEQCDSRGVDTPTCNFDCTLAHCGDGYTNEKAGEQCDPKNDAKGCNFNCTLSSCGDSIHNPADGEECDSGQEDSAFCNHLTCTISRCGDGYTNAASGEQCDPRNDAGKCNINCTLSRCGDGIQNLAAGEECDSYGNDSTFCDGASCKIPRCGDGHINSAAGEKCDDGNAEACGTCNATCTKEQVAGTASGKIVAVASKHIAAGELFSLSDGQKRLFFEFTKSGDAQEEHIAVKIGDDLIDAYKVAIAIEKAINDSDLNIVAAIHVPLDKTVHLLNKKAGPSGNEPVFEWVKDSDFKVSGMSGGAAQDCAEGVACRQDADCLPELKCLSGICSKPPPPPEPPVGG